MSYRTQHRKQSFRRATRAARASRLPNATPAAYAIGQAVLFRDGQQATVMDLAGPAYYLLRSVTGAEFTVAEEEIQGLL